MVESGDEMRSGILWKASRLLGRECAAAWVYPTGTLLHEQLTTPPTAFQSSSSDGTTVDAVTNGRRR